MVAARKQLNGNKICSPDFIRRFRCEWSVSEPRGLLRSLNLNYIYSYRHCRETPNKSVSLEKTRTEYYVYDNRNAEARPSVEINTKNLTELYTKILLLPSDDSYLLKKSNNFTKTYLNYARIYTLSSKVQLKILKKKHFYLLNETIKLIFFYSNVFMFNLIPKSTLPRLVPLKT